MIKLRPVPVARSVSLAAIRIATIPLSRSARSYVHALLAEDLKPYAEKRWPHASIRYYAPGQWPFKRSAEGKPEMTNWIDSFPKNSVFWDIGSNVGVYTLYAASKGVRTCAFEPEASTFHLLQRNIDLNDLHGPATAFNIALSDRTGMAGFQLSQLAIATPRHQVTDLVTSTNGLPCRIIATMTGRDAAKIFDLPLPTHANIDVDGNELLVLRGLPMEDLIEIKCEMRRNDMAPKIVSMLDAAGFVTEGCLDLVNRSRDKAINYVFKRR
ncbi:MAG TPA: FkbM family methyltransferase [Xanthobacteraceae bacterium]|nr:FkbM family methyltransferase [Xanthobacteraceae bacterium]